MNKDFYTNILDDSGDRFDVYEKILNIVDNIIFQNNYAPIKDSSVAYSTKVSKMITDMQLDARDIQDIEDDLQDEFQLSFSLAKSDTIGDLVKYIYDNSKNIPKPAPKLDVKPPVAKVAAPTQAPPAAVQADKEYGLLLLPSLEEYGRIIVIQPITLGEAQTYINEFAAKVLKTKKTKVYDSSFDPADPATQHADYYHYVVDFNSLKKDLTSVEALDKELQGLTKSEIPTFRGHRPVFLSSKIIGVGTTVVFNENWATLNFSDYTIYKKLATLAEKYKA